MKRISKTQVKEMAAHQMAIEDAHRLLEEAVATYNEKVDRAFAEVDAAKVKYETALDEANAWREAIAEEIEAYQSERSETWADTESGQAQTEWLGQWQEEIETEVEIEEPDPLEAPEVVQIEWPEESES